MGGDGSANFAGDAQLPLMPRGALKFVTFALDSKTDIRRTDQGVKQTRLGKAVNGQLTVTVRSRWNIDYEITPPQDEDREVFLEEPRSDSWKAAGDGQGRGGNPHPLPLQGGGAQGQNHQGVPHPGARRA